MWNTSFHCSPRNQKLCVAKAKPRFMDVVSVTGRHVLWVSCFSSVWDMFRVLNTNHKLNDLTSKATALKGLHLKSIRVLRPGVRSSSVQAEYQCLTCRHIQALPWVLESCVQTSAGERMDGRGAELDHCAWNDISLQNVFKTTKAFCVIPLNVYFLKIQICNKTICIKIKLLLICC